MECREKNLKNHNNLNLKSFKECESSGDNQMHNYNITDSNNNSSSDNSTIIYSTSKAVGCENSVLLGIQLEVVMAFGFESIGSFPVKADIFTGTSIFLVSFISCFLSCDFSRFQMQMTWYSTYSTSVSPEITGT